MKWKKEQDKTPEEKLNKVEISDLPNKDINVIIIKMLNEPGRMNAMIRLTKVRKYKEEQNRVEEYNNWNKECTLRDQQ